MRDKGARCGEIPEELPGVGYVAVDGTPEPIRVRFAFVDDPEIDRMAATYRPGSTEAPEDARPLVGASSTDSTGGAV